MKLIVLFFIVLTFDTSWQQESKETLNETLDRLIKQTSLGDPRENNITALPDTKNNSRIFYLNSQDSIAETEKETMSTIPTIQIDNNNQVSIRDILQALGLGNSKFAAENTADNNNNIKEITVSRTVKTPQKTSNDNSDTSGLLEQMISKSGRSDELDNNSVNPSLNLGASTDSNLLHKYPEIIIDKITYHDDKKKAGEGTETKTITQKVDQVAKEQNNYTLEIAQEIKTLLKELQKMKATETASENNSQRNDETTDMPATKLSQDTQQPCGNELEPYTSPCNSALLNKLIEYQNLLYTDPGIDMWGVHNTRRSAVMTISRAQKLKRIHFITQLIHNMMSNFFYRPLYGYY